VSYTWMRIFGFRRDGRLKLILNRRENVVVRPWEGGPK
jgi:hypothetical protein